MPVSWRYFSLAVLFKYNVLGIHPFLNVTTNSTSVLSVADNNQLFTTDNEFGVISADKTVTLISNGVHWVLLGAQD